MSNYIYWSDDLVSPPIMLNTFRSVNISSTPLVHRNEQAISHTRVPSASIITSVISGSPIADPLLSSRFSCSLWKDHWGLLHPGVADLLLALFLYKTPTFFDVWDLSEEYILFSVMVKLLILWPSMYIAVPAQLNLGLLEPKNWENVALCPDPDVRFMDIRCISHNPRSSCCVYSVLYNQSLCGEGSVDLTKGIVVTESWRKTFAGPHM